MLCMLLIQFFLLKMSLEGACVLLAKNKAVTNLLVTSARSLFSKFVNYMSKIFLMFEYLDADVDY